MTTKTHILLSLLFIVSLLVILLYNLEFKYIIDKIKLYNNIENNYVVKYDVNNNYIFSSKYSKNRKDTLIFYNKNKVSIVYLIENIKYNNIERLFNHDYIIVLKDSYIDTLIKDELNSKIKKMGL